MNVLIIGNPNDEERFRIKFGNDHNITLADTPPFNLEFVPEVIFWFNMDENKEFLGELNEFDCPIMVNIPAYTLLELNQVYGPSSNVLIGFCGLPTFFEREIIEISVLEDTNEEEVRNLMKKLQSDYEIVEDRVGMVTPRTLFMIINEAYYTNMEGTASKKDIDISMIKGTNYPYGPFEWADKIGINHVFEILEAIHFHTGDSRYKVCEKLRKEYLKVF